MILAERSGYKMCTEKRNKRRSRNQVTKKRTYWKKWERVHWWTEVSIITTSQALTQVEFIQYSWVLAFFLIRRPPWNLGLGHLRILLYLCRSKTASRNRCCPIKNEGMSPTSHYYQYTPAEKDLCWRSPKFQPC